MTHEVFRVSNSPYRELHAERPAASMSACRDAAERVQEAFG
jgi:hypothetical protein